MQHEVAHLIQRESIKDGIMKLVEWDHCEIAGWQTENASGDSSKLAETLTDAFW